MNRKQRRANKIKNKQKGSKKKNLDEKLGLFDLIPKDCMICHAQFDKTNREMVTTWHVTVREKEKIVRVYCPTCWSKAEKLINELGTKQNEEGK